MNYLTIFFIIIYYKAVMLNNLDPRIWGKSYWDVIHIILLQYPENPTPEDKDAVRQFFELLKSIMPCQTCTSHYAHNLLQFPLSDDILSSKNKLIEWGLTLENEVNSRTGKKNITYDDLIKKYSPHVINWKKIITIMLFILLIILLICYVKIN